MPTLLRIASARVLFARFVLAFFVAATTAAAMTASASAQNVPRAYAGIAVDAKTGQVLYQDSANELRYPASLTKVMTLYILFQELEAGRLRLDSKLSVSAHAAAAVPTKLYVRSGSTIKVEDAIKALVTLSANDVARVIGENISGTESKFAERMTQTARALGMSRTTYKNASGLPDSGQVTTAADQATLARAIYLHFPHYYDYFQTRSFTYGSKTYGNHNALLGQNGVDGIKTGYINASGYNLMTAARANNRHIVVIGLGFNTGASRNARVAELVREYLPDARQGDYWREAMIPRPTLLGNGIAVASAGAAVPLNRLPPARPVSLLPVITEEQAMQVAALSSPEPNEPETIPFQVVSAEDIPSRPGDSALDQATYVATGVMPSEQPVYPANDPIGAWIAETMKLGPTSSDVTAQPGALVPPAPIARPEGLAVDPMSTNASATVPAGGWVVQVGAADSEDGANQMISEATRTYDQLANLRSYVETFERNGVTYYRARFAGFADRTQARTTCDALAAASINCLTVQG
ncbi:D-alanyl-D-alanine carboxypeptidase [Pelagibacterium sp. 26DY04]|uniref:D-alanyl-D-alanine carboxypeptidase n=1 Tax=Pelagibacterium sp. 26DY04 TaxID=2967130 RepID=UPI0028169B16|nr:D-alanyl-D-alanine carboxypeptidase [Pelagibacterium sp. 26DY04]WMT85366.1 D-alanyl-D-alanine carboxypeptidase [Pelagibacterium sp. 26DY04]